MKVKKNLHKQNKKIHIENWKSQVRQKNVLRKKNQRIEKQRKKRKK